MQLWYVWGILALRLYVISTSRLFVNSFFENQKDFILVFVLIDFLVFAIYSILFFSLSLIRRSCSIEKKIMLFQHVIGVSGKIG